MKSRNNRFALRATVLAVQTALVGMFLVPVAVLAEPVANEEVADLTLPSNTLDVGLSSVGQGSDKFGEYNGLNKAGTTLIGNIRLRGGSVYGEGGGLGTKRWSVDGNDLGTTSESLSGSVSEQGQWSLGFGYDELRHNFTESYRTPLQGSMGGNNFTLPSSFGIINTTVNTTILAGQAGTQTLTPTQQSYFQSQDVYSGRQKTSFNADYILDRQWSFNFELSELKQTGAKLIMGSSDANASSVGVLANNSITLKQSTGIATGSYYTVEAMMMLMNPTNYTTDTANLTASWKGDKGHMTVGYFGSIFKDGYNGLSWQSPMAACAGASGSNAACTLGAGVQTGTIPVNPFPTNTLSTAPSNEFHQLNLSGGYAFSPTRKLAGSLSFGRNTQNESFVNDPNQMQNSGVLPQASLNGLVVSQHADLKLTDQTTKDWLLSAGVKYNLRDNQTAAQTYNFIDLGDKTRTSVTTPMSHSKSQLELAADYRIDKNQKVRLSYEYEDIERWCNDPLSNNAQSSVAPTGYYTTASCAQVPSTKENKLAAAYRVKASEDVAVNAGLSAAKRVATVNPSFYNPMQSNSEGFEATGYRAFFDAARDEQVGKAGINWDVASNLNLAMNVRYANDVYTDSGLGVQNGHKWGTNLDAAYQYSDNTKFSSFFSYETRYRTLNNASTITSTVSPLVGSNIWTNEMWDDQYTVGVSYRQKGLMSGKFDIASDLTYSLGATTYSTAVPYNAACATPATGGTTCGRLPAIQSELYQFKLIGTYQVDKKSKVRVGYVYQNLTTNDYYYNAYQTGYTPTSLLPTDQQLPSYSVHLLYAAYVVNF